MGFALLAPPYGLHHFGAPGRTLQYYLVRFRLRKRTIKSIENIGIFPKPVIDIFARIGVGDLDPFHPGLADFLGKSEYRAARRR